MSEINIKPFPLTPFLSVCGEGWLAPRGGLLVCVREPGILQEKPTSFLLSVKAMIDLFEG